MNVTNPFNKSVFVVLGLGAVIGGLAVANIKNIVPVAQAGQNVVQSKPISTISTENMAVLKALDNSFANLADYIEPSVVHIRSEGKGGTDLFGRRTGAVGGVGTGVIFRSDGWVITNDHVVNGFDKVTVVLADGREFVGTVRRAEDSDIAAVKIDAKDLPAASFGDSGKVRPGQFAMAVGSPFGLDKTVTIGHISAIGRTNTIADPRALYGERYYPDLIQTDAPINQGNSGGPLVNVEGQVVGINSAIMSSSGGSNGIGFAIPSNQARLLAETLIEKGKIVRGAMGLVPVDLKDFQKKEMKIEGGALVSKVPNDGPAAIAGIKQGDVITRVGTVAIKSQIDVRNSMLRYAPGQTVEVMVIRDGQPKTLSVKLSDPATVNKNLLNNAPLRSDDGSGGDASPFQDTPDLPNMDQLIPRNREPGTSVPPIRAGKAQFGVKIDVLNDANRKLYDIPANVQGVVVKSVDPGSVAARLQMSEGSVIQQIGSKKVSAPTDVSEAMKSVNWGDTVSVTFGKFSSKMQMTQTTPVEFR